MSAELQLLLAAAFFYLYDASILLYANEAVITPAGAGRWRLVFQPNSIALRGRLLYVPNPMLPHRPVYRIAWTPAADQGADKVDWPAQADRYSRLLPFVYLSALAIFVLLPLCLFWRRSDLQLLAAAGLVYAISIAAGIAVVKWRNALGLSGRKAWTTALECVLCPPFTVNLVRRLSIVQRLDTSIPAAGAALLDGYAWDQLRSRLVAAQDEAIEDTQSGEQRAALMLARARLMQTEGRHEHD